MLSDRLAQLEPPLQELCQQLTQWLGQQAEPPVASPVSSDIRPILQRLADLLADDDSEALTILEEHQASLQQQAPRRLAQLDEAIRQFEFEQALALVKAWQEEC